MIDKLDIASKNWAEDYMTQHGKRFHNMLREAFIAGFKKGANLTKRHGEWEKPPYKGASSYFCNQCGAQTARLTNFCSNCGADMRGNKDD